MAAERNITAPASAGNAVSGTSTPAAKPRNLAYDLLRILAISLVVMNHRAIYLHSATLEPLSPIWIIETAFDVIVRCGAPIFFMISGALLLGKNESLEKLFKHRILRMAIATALVWLYLCVAHYGFARFFEVYKGLNWFFFSYLSFLLLLPLLRPMVQHMDRDAQLLWFVLTAVLGTCAIGLFVTRGKAIDFFPFTGMPFMYLYPIYSIWHIIYPMAGYFLSQLHKSGDREAIGKAKRVLGIGAPVAIALDVVFEYFFVRNIGSGELVDQVRQFMVFLPSCAIFLFAIDAPLALPGRTAKLVTKIASATFGMFLIEVGTFYSEKMERFIRGIVPAVVNDWWNGLITAVVVLVTTCVIVLLAKKVPGLKQLL